MTGRESQVTLAASNVGRIELGPNSELRAATDRQVLLRRGLLHAFIWAPPREFVLMDRAAVGLGGVFLRLKAEINWFRLFQDLIADFDEATLAKRQRDALAEAGLADDVSFDGNQPGNRDL